MVPIAQSIQQSVQSQQQKSQNYQNVPYNQYYAGQPNQQIQPNQQMNNVMIQSQPQYQSQTQYQSQGNQPQYQSATQPQIPMTTSVKQTVETSSVQVHISKTIPDIGSTYHPVNIHPE